MVFPIPASYVEIGMDQKLGAGPLKNETILAVANKYKRSAAQVREGKGVLVASGELLRTPARQIPCMSLGIEPMPLILPALLARCVAHTSAFYFVSQKCTHNPCLSTLFARGTGHAAVGDPERYRPHPQDVQGVSGFHVALGCTCTRLEINSEPSRF